MCLIRNACLFHVDHEIRDLTNQYVQADQQTLSDKETAKFLARGLKLQNERNEILHNYIEKPKKNGGNDLRKAQA